MPLKWIASGLVALGIASVGIPAIGHLSDRDNEAERLVYAAALSNDQAGDLSSSYTAIIPTIDAEGEPIAPAQQAEARPTLGPKYQEFATQSEHEVQAAMDYLNRLLAEAGPPPQTAYINAVNQLHHAWQPRYGKAAADYKVFAYRIHHTEKMAQEYFEAQANLTFSIADQEKRRRAEANDFLEREAYLDWREQATTTLAQARLIKQDLDDMNVIITKQVLSANFAALYENFQAMPQSTLTLHAEIAEFQRRSDQITATFGPLSQL